MTQEEKAKAYDEAIEKFEVILNLNTVKESGTIFADDVRKILPELKELEGERIREWLISLIKSNEYGPISNVGEMPCPKPNVIAWLEKQGVQEEPQVYETEDGETIAYSETDGYKVVEPKFHEGDWIINGTYATIMQVVNNKDFYESVGINGQRRTDTYKYIERDFRLWTIQDAKDGDVLVDGDNNIGLYRGEKDDVDWDSYIYLGCDGKLRGFSIGGKHEQNGTHPATKEQRDTLEKAMEDAGYSFAFDKKEVKKIELKTTEGWYDFIRWFVKQRTDDYTLIPSEDDIHKWGNNILNYARKVLGQNHDWSEKDEEMLQGIWDEILANKHNAREYEWRTYDRFLSWLKSLKDRVQPQQEWSEEDETVLDNLIYALANDRIGNDRDEYVDWLKSIKDRYTWKPSDEQMDALDWALSLAKNCGEECAFDLRTLQEQLTKLKG